MCRTPANLTPHQRRLARALNLLALVLMAVNLAHPTPALFTSGCALLCLSMSLRRPRAHRNPTGEA